MKTGEQTEQIREKSRGVLIQQIIEEKPRGVLIQQELYGEVHKSTDPAS